MFEKVAQRVTRRLLQKGIIVEEEQEIYEFGVAQGCNIFWNLLTIVILGICFDSFVQAILILLAFMQLRSYAGGFHAKTASGCYVLTTAAMALLLWIQKTVAIDAGICLAFLGISGSIIVLLAPIETPEHILDALEKTIYRRKAVRIWIVECIAAAVCIWTPFKTISICITLAHILLSFSMLCGWISNGKAKRKMVQWN